MKQPPLDESERLLLDELQRDLRVLAHDIGERNLYRYPALCDAADWLTARLRDAGLPVRRQSYQVEGKACVNIEAMREGSRCAGEIVVVGAHYDTVWECPGANDNGTGVAALLALARRFATRRTARTLRFVAFVNEEPPYFQTPDMGSYVYAAACRERAEAISAMLSLETIGYYSQAPKSQSHPFPLGALFPHTADFIAFVANRRSRQLVNTAATAFKAQTSFPVVHGALPIAISGVAWSDHWAFWQHGYPAMMVTDTAPYRYRFYHTPEDTIDKIQFESYCRVVAGLQAVVAILSGAAPEG